jgi:PHD/YefM family antitoxin component YafN of YafNO toxin-antitoxin module
MSDDTQTDKIQQVQETPRVENNDDDPLTTLHRNDPRANCVSQRAIRGATQ